MQSSLNQKLSQEEADYKRALAVAPYHDDEAVGRQTAAIVAAGHSILQIHRLGRSDEEHVAALLDMLDPPPGARVLDAGCGVGRVAELMVRARPDLRFVLLNVSGAQLEMCPAAMERLRGDFHAIPLPDASVDAALFLYSLGHGLLSRCMAEAARVLRPGGILFIYDLAADDGSALIDTLGYCAHPAESVEEAAHAAGFRTGFIELLAETSVEDFMTIMDPAAYQEVFAGVDPVAYRFVKC